MLMLLPRRYVGCFASRAVAAGSAFQVLRRRCFSGNVDQEASKANKDATYGLEADNKVSLTSEVDQYDIAIVGGGMVGLSVACALSSMPLTKELKLAIIDSKPALTSGKCLRKDAVPDPRVSTVTPATISFFKDIGAWNYVLEQRHTFFNMMQVWDYTGLGYTRYNARDVDKEYLGCVVENRVISTSLFLCLQSKNCETMIFSARLNSVTFGSQNSSAEATRRKMDNQSASLETPPVKNTMEQEQIFRPVKLELSDGRSLYASLVVGADGAKSRVRELAGVKTIGWKYPQSAVICTVEHSTENHCAWQRFLPSGPIALLPIGDKFSNIVWTMDPDGASKHELMSKHEFVTAVNHALDYGYGPHPQSGFLDQYMKKLPWLTREDASRGETFEVPPTVISVVSERMAFPLSLMHAHDYASKRVVLVGDAAHTVHPLAGQGVNLGFGDASALSTTIANGILTGADVGEMRLLKKYERERKSANITMMAILDGFQKAYSIDLGPVNILRAAAFHSAQYIRPLKKRIVSYATGEQKWPLFL